MGDDETQVGEEESTAGIAAKHPATAVAPIVGARTASGTKTANTVRPPDLPVACWRMDDVCFAFDRAFVELTAKKAFAQLAALHADLKKTFSALYNKRPLMTLFGHADYVGPEDYNKTLSENRAKAVYAVLTRKPGLWLEIFSGTKLAYLQKRIHSSGTGSVSVGGKLEQAIRQHMDTLCGSFKLEEQDFLGGEPSAYRGCSEYNPVLVFSNSEYLALEKNRIERNLQNQPNRRVTGFFFVPSTIHEEKLLACPKAPDPAGCRNMFVSDGADRLANGPARKTFPSEPTFACEIYDTVASLSPCESYRKRLKVSLGFEGDAPFVQACEKLEIDSGAGKTIPSVEPSILAYDEEELRACYDEVCLNHRRAKPRTRSEAQEWERVASMKFDPDYLEESRAWVAAVVEIKFSKTGPPGKETYHVNARVYAYHTKNNLFSGQVSSKYVVGQRGIWYLSSPGDQRRKVWRRVAREEDVPADKRNHIRKNLNEPEGLVDKMNELHKQLCGSFASITERVHFVLFSAAE